VSIAAAGGAFGHPGRTRGVDQLHAANQLGDSSVAIAPSALRISAVTNTDNPTVAAGASSVVSVVFIREPLSVR
jgi:hypothetical protein